MLRPTLLPNASTHATLYILIRADPRVTANHWPSSSLVTLPFAITLCSLASPSGCASTPRSHAFTSRRYSHVLPCSKFGCPSLSASPAVPSRPPFPLHPFFPSPRAAASLPPSPPPPAPHRPTPPPSCPAARRA